MKKNININADDDITVTIKGSALAVIMNALRDVPYGIAQPVVDALTAEIQKSLEAGTP